ncbi:Uncharacterised protein [Neisseria meningitidis]|nr:Uncharacterised protein [Neisseria meningitidis]
MLYWFLLIHYRFYVLDSRLRGNDEMDSRLRGNDDLDSRLRGNDNSRPLQ